MYLSLQLPTIQTLSIPAYKLTKVEHLTLIIYIASHVASTWSYNAIQICTNVEILKVLQQ